MGYLQVGIFCCWGVFLFCCFHEREGWVGIYCGLGFLAFVLGED